MAALNAVAIQQFREQIRDESESENFAQLIALLTPILEFLGASCSAKMAAIRVWALLYAVRPDLIEFESLASAAKRFDVAEPIFSRVLRELKAAVPGFRYAHREPDNVKIGHAVVAAIAKRSSKTLQGRHSIQRRAALLKAGAKCDTFGEFAESSRSLS